MPDLTRRSWFVLAGSLLAPSAYAQETSGETLIRENFEQKLIAAQKDKENAVEQMSLQVDDNETKSHSTLGFRNLADENPWLNHLHRTVALLKTMNERQDELGSGSLVLLDREGTVILCAHEHMGVDSTATFYLENGSVLKAKLGDFFYDRIHDLMFGTLKLDAKSIHKLSPIVWGHIGFAQGKQTDREIINVGFPAPSYHLHATNGNIKLRIDHLRAANENQDFFCQIEDSAVSFSGMSGGGVFVDGAFVGMISTGSALGSEATSGFVPVNLIKKAYVELYPDRAQKAKVSVLPQRASKACRISGSNFSH